MVPLAALRKTGQENMNIKFAVFAAVSLVVSAAANADSMVAGSYEAGEAKSIVCGACHGPKGNSVNPAWPSIAGQHAPYSLKQLQDFKNGARTGLSAACCPK